MFSPDGSQKYLLLVGGIMLGDLDMENQRLAFHNAGGDSYVQPGSFGAGGVSLFCRGTELNWQDGHLSNYSSRYVPIILDSSLQFESVQILDSSAVISINPNSRTLCAGATSVLDWSGADTFSAPYWFDSGDSYKLVGNAGRMTGYRPSNLDQQGATNTQVLTWTGINWSPADLPGGGGPFLPLAGGTMAGTILMAGNNIDFGSGGAILNVGGIAGTGGPLAFSVASDIRFNTLPVNMNDGSGAGGRNLSMDNGTITNCLQIQGVPFTFLNIGNGGEDGININAPTVFLTPPNLAGANFGPGLPTSITVVNGVVTACS